MKKTGNLCIRALCAIFVGIVFGCSGSSGGGNGEMGGQTGGNGGNEEGTGWTKPAYMNITAEFGGQQFLKLDGVRWYDDQNRDANFETSYKNAMVFMGNEVKGLSDKQYGDLSTEINKLLTDYNKGSNISETIDKNFTALAPVIYNMTKGLSDNDYQEYKVSYYKLAHNAYQNSLSTLKDNTTLTVNKEMKNNTYPNNFFAKELDKTNRSDLSLTDAKTIMENNLSTISAKTSTDLAVLKKIIELASYNESLCGLNDYAVAESVTNNNLHSEHSITDLDLSVRDYRNSMTRNLDDGRTM